MKSNLHAFALVLLVAGLLAAAAYPSHSDTLMAVGTGGAPTPTCSPWDGGCDPGPAFRTVAKENPKLENSAPIPICSPWDKTCDRGPSFPIPNVKPEVANSAPIPICSPWDKRCDRGPSFPLPNVMPGA